VVFRRVHSFTHSFPTQRIPRALLNPHHRLVRQDYIALHNMPGRTHIGSWLYFFMGGRSMNRSLDLDMMTNHRLSRVHRTQPRSVRIHQTQFQTCDPNHYYPHYEDQTSTDMVTKDKGTKITTQTHTRTCGAKHFYYPKRS
jgi:hypothetical protein